MVKHFKTRRVSHALYTLGYVYLPNAIEELSMVVYSVVSFDDAYIGLCAFLFGSLNTL